MLSRSRRVGGPPHVALQAALGRPGGREQRGAGEADGQGVGLAAGLGGDDALGVGRERGVRNRLSGERPRIGGAHPVAVEGGRDVDEPHVRDVVRPRVGHGTGDGGVQLGQHELGRGVGAGGIGFETGAEEVRLQPGLGGALGNLGRGGHRLVVVEHGDRACIGRDVLNGPGEARADTGQFGGQCG